MKNSLALFLLFFAVSGLAQQRIPAAETYGTLSQTALVLPEQAFQPWDHTTTYAVVFESYVKYVSNNGGCCLNAPVTLPEGAQAIGIEIEGCDTSATAELSALFIGCQKPASACQGSLPFAGSGVSATPLCGTFRADFFQPVTINNANNIYFVEVHTDTAGATTLRAVRVYYKLQISPDPAITTFGDVPIGHPFHRFVEALAAAGITGGCGGGNYCPDAPITRGQMAVFLSAALGLHFVP